MSTCNFKSFRNVGCKEKHTRLYDSYILNDCSVDVTENSRFLLNKNSHLKILEYDLIMMRAGLKPDIGKFKLMDWAMK
jgi:hypothetical protein